MLTQKQRRLLLYNRKRIFVAGDELLEIKLAKGGAGAYSDVPSRRMPWDTDGVVFLVRRVAVVATGFQEISAAEATEANDEDNVRAINFENVGGNDLIASGPAQELRLAWIFPELREVDGYFRANDDVGTQSISEVLTSGDTTNGLDGTHTSRIATYTFPAEPYPTSYRDNITSMAVSNVRSLAHRWNTQDNQPARFLKAAHIYGEISAGETPDRLLWFDQPSALEFDKPIDYGDVPRGSAEDRVTFLKNNSASLTASTVQVTAEALYLGSGSWYTFEEAGVPGFTATLSLASSIGAAANSPNITIRRIIPDAEVLGLHAGRAFVSVGSWA